MFTNPGTRLLIPNKPGFLYVVKGDNETLDSVIAKYRKDPALQRTLKEKAIDINRLPGTAYLGAYHLEPRETLLLPGVMPPDFDTNRFPFSDGGWTRISSGFGRRFHPVLGFTRKHDGWDLPKPWGTKVYPSRSGKVVFAGWKGGYGNMIQIQHNNGESTVYGHLSKIIVHMGQWVQRGNTLLGRVGSTGISTGPHLHFEMRDRFGHAVNPRTKIGRR
jgi:murein DD-endopeptidase MepM/ murein hydrolase activator NlpD